MSYLPWAIVALAAYTLVAPLMRVATTGADAIPSDVATMISNTILVLAAVAVAAYSHQDVTAYFGSSKVPYAVGAGICLAVGILAYYRALSLGPVSVVTPVFGLFLVTSSLLGVVALGEELTARKLLGIAFAVLAVYLVTVE